jgi:hypothetical protein
MSEYSVNGAWTAHQSNGFHVDFKIRQSHINAIAEKSFKAEATQFNSHNENRGSGTGDGVVFGDQFHLEMKWGDGSSIGIYNGTFDLNGFITGVTFDKMHPENVAAWNSAIRFDHQWRP